jgi:hypothetical protein
MIPVAIHYTHNMHEGSMPEQDNSEFKEKNKYKTDETSCLVQYEI